MSVLRAVPKRTYLPAADRRAQILDVARGVFSKLGYQKASIADVCEAAKIGRGTLYQYFDNKGAVLTALVEEVADRIRAILAARRPLDDLPGLAETPVPMIVEFCVRRLREVVEAIFVDEATVRLVLVEARGREPEADAVVAEIDRLILGAIEGDVKAAQKVGLLRKGSPRWIARYLLGGVERIVMGALADDEPVDLDRLVRTTVELQLFGLLSRRGDA